MLGLFFMGLEDFLDTTLDEEAWNRALAGAGLGPREFDPGQDYPEEEAIALVGEAARLLDQPLDQTLEGLGRHMAGGLMEMGVSMGLVAEEWGSMDVLERLPQFLPSAIAAYNPDVEPFDIRTLRLRHGETVIAYFSQRQLCSLIKGIVLGLGDYFDEPVAYEEPVCQHRGAPLCRISVFLDDPLLLRFVDVPREFETIRRRGEEITLFNQFQGVPLTGPAQVIGYDREEATIRAMPEQLSAMAHQGRTYISVPHLPIGLSAQVYRVDPQTGSARLHKIELADGHIGHRTHNRVEPEKPIPARFMVEGQEFRARLINLSAGGASLSLDAKALVDERALFNPVWVSFTLPLKYMSFGDTLELGPQELAAWGNLLHVEEQGKQRMVRVIFQDLTSRDRALIHEFHRERREKVVDELRKMTG
ncbi:MAG: DUF2378 family protein [Magnetococcales bacterium]|nr:DUF2378 family protein [Magnetococcales bacterium]